MRFNPKARLDTSHVRDVGGGGGTGGGMGGGPVRVPLPGGVRAGGGMAGLIITILFIVLAQCAGVNLPTDPGTGTLGGGFDTSQMVGSDSGRYSVCKTGADIESHPDCEYVAVENSLREFWGGTDLGTQFSPSTVETFSGQVSTGCGAASSDTGPFYCPPDAQIYLDTTFFRDVLEGQLGGPEGQFVIAYVVAHEYGHHIQNLLGTMGQVKTQQGPHSDSVKLELQADCYAGMWANHATTTEGPDGEVLIQELTDDDIQQGIDAATAVGDDTIQTQTGGQPNPEQWTHGSSEQRVQWFTTGLKQGTLDACDTFAPGAV